MNKNKSLSICFGLAILVCLLGTGYLSQAWGDGYIVVIDPGHGGTDAGVKLSRSVSEADFTLSVAKKIKEILAKKKEIKVTLTRQGDQDLSVESRKEVARTTKANLFLSLHVNAGFGNKALGYEIYFRGFDHHDSGKDASGKIVDNMIETKYLNDSIRFSNLVEKELGKVFVRQGRGLRGAPVAVLKELEMPALLIELGFATNIKNKDILLKKDVQNNVAMALAKSIETYFSSSGSL